MSRFRSNTPLSPPPTASSQFTDSAINLTTSPTTKSQSRPSTARNENIPRPTLSARLAHLASLAANSDSLPSSVTVHLHHQIDELEYSLNSNNNITDPPPPPPISQETKHHTSTPTTASTDHTTTNQEKDIPTPTANTETDLLTHLTRTTTALHHRRTETLHLHALFTLKLEALAQRIIHLETSLNDSQRENLENEIMIDAMRGTVRGLEYWIVERFPSSPPGIVVEEEQRPEVTRSRSSRFRQNEKFERLLRAEREKEVLIEGIAGWLRGWRDVEEGFRLKGRTRRRRMMEKEEDDGEGGGRVYVMMNDACWRGREHE